ncbi:MAG: division/cell wall cluster transcriptional repressor MraZ [Planctomycetota bacterium]|jgi:MraZ protein
MFLGEVKHRLNAKNQVTIPSRFRSVLSEEERTRGFYLVRANSDCLHLYTHAEIAKRMEQVTAVLRPAGRREITRRITPVDMDSQGRVVIPEDAKKEAGIRKEVVVVGNADRVEIWAPANLERVTKQASKDKQVAEIMNDLFE